MDHLDGQSQMMGQVLETRLAQSLENVDEQQHPLGDHLDGQSQMMGQVLESRLAQALEDVDQQVTQQTEEAGLLGEQQFELYLAAKLSQVWSNDDGKATPDWQVFDVGKSVVPTTVVWSLCPGHCTVQGCHLLDCLFDGYSAGLLMVEFFRLCQLLLCQTC